MEARFATGIPFVYETLREQYPDRPKHEIDQVVSKEGEYEAEFRRKMRDRLKADLPKALAIPDPATRNAAIAKLLEREKRYTRQREEAILNRAIARIEMNLLMELSPEGAFWRLSPMVREHTLDCLAMGGKFWPWTVLKRLHPPLHAGCPCELWGLQEAVEAGFMTADQVPDQTDAERRFERLVERVQELQDALGIEECNAAVEEILSSEAGVLVEAKPPGHTGAMVALYPEPTVARRLAQDGGEPVRELHVTLAFLGKAKDLADHDRLKQVVEGIAASTPPLTGEVSGIGLFTAGPEPVTYASVDMPGLPAMRERLVAALKGGGWPAANDHGFTPHMTLAYDDRARDLKLPNPKLRFTRLTLKLGDRSYHFPFGGTLEEARRRDPLRWAKGLVKGGEFRPTRGGSSARTVARALLPDGTSTPVRGRARGDHGWEWVKGQYTRIPKEDRWERRYGGAHYTSPPGTTEVYRNGEPTVPAVERARTAGPVAPDTPPALAAKVMAQRAERRRGARERAEEAVRVGKKSKPPVRKGDGPEALFALPFTGFALRRASPGTGGTVLEYDNGDAELVLGWDGRSVREVAWEPTARPREVRAPISRPPRSFEEFTRDVLAWGDELGLRFNAEVNLPSVRATRRLHDHAGQHLWSGGMLIGRDVPGDIAAAAKARREKRELTEAELRGVYASYWVAGHELGHAVNEESPFLYQGAYMNLSEALAEEVGHVLAVERLTETNQLDVVEWRKRNQDHPVVRGNYQAARHELALLLDMAGLDSQEARRDFLFELAFQTDPAKRTEKIAERIKAARPKGRESLALIHAQVEAALETPGVDAEMLRPVLVFDKSPGMRQVGRHQYGRFDGVLSGDMKTLTMGSGHRRRVEKLPVVVPELVGVTEGWAVAAYSPDQAFTDGLVNEDGSPKNFRYVDSEDRGKLILRAFAGKGSPGALPDLAQDDIDRVVEELHAAKGLVEIEGVPVKRRFDGSFGIGWFQDGRHLSGVSGEDAAARVILTRAQIDPPWASDSSPWGGPQSPGWGEDPFGEFMKDAKPSKFNPAEWLTAMKETFDKPAPKPGTAKKKQAKAKPVFVGGKKKKVAQGPIPSYDNVRLEVKGTAGGSNGARWAFDKQGNRWLLKTYRGDQDRVATELLANALYREMGAKVAEAGSITVNGKPALTYPTLEGKVRERVFQKEGPSKEVGRHFMVDALLANWDYVGMTDDNIMWDPDGNPFRVDQGGTFEFRAQGQPKPFGPVPVEVWTMLTKGQAARAADVDEGEMRAQASEIVEKLGDAQKLVDAAPFADEDMRKRVGTALAARIGWMDMFAKGEVDLPKPLEGNEAAGVLMKKDATLSLYPEQEDALFGYMEGLDGEINESLRNLKKKRPKPVQRAVDELDSLFRAVKTTDEDVVAWVGFDYDSDKTPFGQELVGKKFREYGYLPATLDADEATKFATVMRLVIPEGSHVLHTQALGYDDLPAEPELLLARNTDLRISKVRTEDGKTVFDAVATTERPWKAWTPPPKKKTKAKPPPPAEPDPDDPEQSTFWDDLTFDPLEEAAEVVAAVEEAFLETDHPRAGKGSPTGGQFVAKDGGGQQSQQQAPRAQAARAPAPAKRGQKRRRTPPRIGMNAGNVMVRGDVDSQLRKMKSVGIRDVRLDVSAQTIARSAATGDWAYLDSFANKLWQNDLQWYPIIGYSTSWTADTAVGAQKPPPNLAAFGQAAAQFAQRYQLPAVEIWNEPNMPQFFEGGTPELYGEIYAEAHKAIKAVRPGTRVTTAGLANRPGWEDYLSKMLRSMRKKGVKPDAIGFHPYKGDPLEQVKKLRRMLNRRGLRDTKIEITEFGRKANKGTPRERRRYMAEVTRDLVTTPGLGVSRVMPFVWSGDPEFDLPGGPAGRGFRRGLTR